MKKTFGFDLYCYLSDSPAVDAMVKRCGWKILDSEVKQLPREISQPEIVVEHSYSVEGEQTTNPEVTLAPKEASKTVYLSSDDWEEILREGKMPLACLREMIGAGWGVSVAGQGRVSVGEGGRLRVGK
jgi:hypothetical protein